MWQRFFGLEFRRRRLMRKLAASPLRDYLAKPFPDRSTDYRDVRFVALDLETTGLDARRDEILSIGLVDLRGGRIDLSSAAHYPVLPSRAIPESSAVIHHITDDTAARGRPLGDVLPVVLAHLTGSVLLGHHVSVEKAFLDAACRKLYDAPFLSPLADTESLIRRSLEQRDQPFAGRELRLHALRTRYGLPRYRAHNALIDALATAELFCAFVAKGGFDGKVALKRFLERQ